jgi:hypothetical protein
VLLLGCTPLGAWVYDDPSFHLTRVESRHPGGAGAQPDSLNLVFLACNRNDFDLQLPRVAARLSVVGRGSSPTGSAANYTLPTRTVSEVVVTVSLADSLMAMDQVHRRFDLQGETTVSTPSGDRLVVWKQRGSVWRTGDSLHWVGEQGIPCRPGLSQLPSYFTPPPPIAPPVVDDPPARVRPDSGESGRPTGRP